jgi:hypothetical protein
MRRHAWRKGIGERLIIAKGRIARVRCSPNSIAAKRHMRREVQMRVRQTENWLLRH